MVQLTASQKYGVVTQAEYMELAGARIVVVQKDFDILKKVCAGDFIIHMRSFQGGLEYSTKSGSISSAYVMLIPQKSIAEPRYYRWFFKSPVYIDALSSTSNLVRDGQAMRWANFIQLPIPIPPADEQIGIADFLDAKCAEVDSVIADKKKQLETIAEYKKSLIFEYVTGKKEVPAVTSPTTITAIDPHLILAGIAIKGLGAELLGKIQLEKVLYFFDYYLGLGLNTQYYRFPHGPYDIKLDSYLNILQNRGWFKKISTSPEKYIEGHNYSDFCEEKENNPALLNAGLGFDKVISFVKTMKKTRQVERAATLFAVWNDFLIDGITPSDDQIICEVINNWTENKGHTKYLTWMGSLNKLKKSGIVPKGIGLHTLPMMQKGNSHE